MNAELDNMQVVSDQVNKTVSNAALSLVGLGFTDAQVKSARAAFISVEGNGIRYRYGTPTASNGHPIAAGDSGWVQGRKALQELKLIRSSGSDATVNITLFK